MKKKRLPIESTQRLAVCTGALARLQPICRGGTPVPVLQLTFRRAEGAVETRRFLLDRRHPERLLTFLEGFLGHAVLRLWELDPRTLLGRQGPLPES